MVLFAGAGKTVLDRRRGQARARARAAARASWARVLVLGPASLSNVVPPETCSRPLWALAPMLAAIAICAINFFFLAPITATPTTRPRPHPLNSACEHHGRHRQV